MLTLLMACLALGASNRFLDRHNYWRNEAASGRLVSAAGRTPRAANMAKMVWDSTLAKRAQELAAKCKMEHSRDPITLRRGENLFFVHDNPNSNKAVEDQAVEVWAGEVTNYNPSTGKCNAGKVCGHFTQVVWAKTTHLGCGKAKCKSPWGFPIDGTLVFCQYTKPGNYQGHLPYVKASVSASACHSKDSTFPALCSASHSNGGRARSRQSKKARRHRRKRHLSGVDYYDSMDHTGPSGPSYWDSNPVESKIDYYDSMDLIENTPENMVHG